MKKSTHKRLTAWLLTLALVVTLLPGMGMTALAVEDGGEGNGPPAVEVVESEGGNSGSDETVGTPPLTEPEPPTPPESTEEDKTTEDEGDPSGSDYDIEADTQPRGLMRALAAPTATGDYPDPNAVSVDGNKYFAEPGCYYFKNGASACSKDPNNYNAYYNPNTGTLTLNNYRGKGIKAGGVSRTNITVVLIGTNTIDGGNLESDVGGDITVTSSSGGTLSITRTISNSNAASGIETGYSASYSTGNVTIKGNAKVTINMTHSGTRGYEKAYGIFANENITISENASVDITCATPNNTHPDSTCCDGLRAVKDVIIDTTGTIKINVTGAGGSNTQSYGIFPSGKATLTNVGDMEVQWKKHSTNSNYPGGAVLGGASFDTGTHAVNVDKTNCYASYRKGTPRTVTVNNGKLTGPGVKYPNGSGKFLYDDKVDLTAPPRQVSATDSTPISFVKWTSANVSIANSTSQTEAYIMVPYTDTTVQAHYKAFTVQPSFTRINSTKGTVSFTLISTDHSSFPELCPANNLESGTAGFMPVVGTTTYERDVYENSTLPGEYMVKVKYNKVTYYSEPFMIDYSARAASIDPVIISGETGQPIASRDVTVTLQDCTFNTSLGGTGSWITNLPAGLSQSVTRVSDTEAKITVSGTPMVNCVEQIKVTVPKAAISGGSSALTAPSYENAKFDIKTTLTTAAATIQHPVAGQHPDMNPVSAEPSKYTVTLYSWSDVTAADTFEADKWYECNLIFTPQPGYAFASGSDMTYTINGKSAKVLSPWVYLSMEALPSAISLDVSGTVDLGNKKPYETVPVKSIEVTNHISSAISDIPITLSDPTNFRVFPKSITSIPANGTGTFQVAPAPNLSLGEYSTTVTVGGGSSGIIEQSFTVKFSVREVIMLIANPLTYNGEWQTGVTASVAGVTIKGNSQRDAGNYTATAYRKSGFYMWPDYTTDSTKDISWSIGKRTPQPTDIVVTPPTNPVYDSNRKDATAELDSKYTGAGAITISKYVNPDTGEEVQPINAGTYTVYVNVAGGSNFNAATSLNRPGLWNFTIAKAEQNAPVGLSASAPTSSSGKGKINGTAANMQYTKTPDVPTSWSDCTEGSTMVYPGTYYVRYKGDNNHDASPNVKVTVPEYGAGVTVSGTIKSYGSASEAVTVTLLQGTNEVATKTLTGASGSVPYSQNYSFDTVPAGTYTLKVEKKGHAPWTEEITVDSTAIAKDVTVYLWGDVNRDGEVTAADAQEIQRNAAGLSSVFDTDPNSAYCTLRADVNRDGAITAADAQEIQRKAAGLSSTISTLP